MIEIRDILKILPHSYPFLLVDRVLEFEKDRYIKALKNVTFNEPYFIGHFPGNPVMPGVLIVEAIAQAGGILAYHSIDEETRQGMGVAFMGMNKVKFRKPVYPGDQLILEVEVLKVRGNGRIWLLKGKSSVDGRVVCEAEILASFYRWDVDDR